MQKLSQNQFDICTITYLLEVGNVYNDVEVLAEFRVLIYEESFIQNFIIEIYLPIAFSIIPQNGCVWSKSFRAILRSEMIPVAN